MISSSSHRSEYTDCILNQGARCVLLAGATEKVSVTLMDRVGAGGKLRRRWSTQRRMTAVMYGFRNERYAYSPPLYHPPDDSGYWDR